MTAATTPKGERRRAALVAAAGELLVEGGIESVRHRAVAKRARIPLAATTYYFESLDDLVSHAVEYAGEHDTSAIRARVAQVTRRRRGQAAMSRLLAAVFFGCPDEQDHNALLSRYERLIASSRLPALSSMQAATRTELAELHETVLERSGRTLVRENVLRLIAVEDGAVLAALTTPGADVAELVRAAVANVIDEVAPLQS